MPNISPLRELVLMLVTEVSIPAILQRGDAIVYANDACASLFGYTKGELMQMRASQLAAPEERRRIEHYHSMRQRGSDSPTTYHCCAIHADDHRFDINVIVCAAPMNPSQGELLLFVAMQDKTSVALEDFSSQISEYLHEWSKSYLRSIAANLVQASLHNLELQYDSIAKSVDTVTTQIKDIEAQRRLSYKRMMQLVRYGFAGLAFIGQELSLGLGKALVKWIEHLIP